MLEPEDKLRFYEANQYQSMNHESGMDDNGRTRSVSLPRVVNIERTHSVSLLKAIQRGDVDADLLQHYPLLAITKNRQDSTPITTLSGLPSAFPSGTIGLALWQQWIYSCIKVKVKLPAAASVDVRSNFCKEDHIEPTNIKIPVLSQVRKFSTLLLKFSGMNKEIYDLKLNHTYALEILHCMSYGISTLNDNQFDRGTVHEAIFQAVKHGIIEFVVKIIQANPDLIWCNDKNSKDIFMSAIEHRQEEIFSLMYGLDVRKDALVTFTGKDNNMMLHSAGKLAPNSQLSRISGAALQMQRELQWFKEMENIVPHV
ncbi:hypothetical protein SLE2022_080990 [Rubroshorea leprosula]